MERERYKERKGQKGGRSGEEEVRESSREGEMQQHSEWWWYKHMCSGGRLCIQRSSTNRAVVQAHVQWGIGSATCYDCSLALHLRDDVLLM